MSVGTPQGFPISLLLFVIYVFRLHLEIPYCLTLSYMDNFALVASSESYRHNIQLLQKQYAIIKTKGSCLGVSFSIPKTGLIHGRTNRDRDRPSNTPIDLDGEVFHPKGKLRWVGYWFTPSLATAPHFTKHLAKA